MVHAHDHYPVSHHHGGLTGEFRHRSYWHTHDHNHVAIHHSQDDGRDKEERKHGKEAHVHDHASPAMSPS